MASDGLPWWLSGKEFACQCKRHSFSPWVGKIPWRKKWHPTPVFLAGKSHGQRNLQRTEEPELVGLQSMGLQRVGHD